MPTEDACGLDARLSGHFGEAPYFTLIDGNGKKCGNGRSVKISFFTFKEAGNNRFVLLHPVSVAHTKVSPHIVYTGP